MAHLPEVAGGQVICIGSWSLQSNMATSKMVLVAGLTAKESMLPSLVTTGWLLPSGGQAVQMGIAPPGGQVEELLSPGLPGLSPP